MSDNTNKIAEKLAGMPVQWWGLVFKAAVIVQQAELSEEGFAKALESAGKELARLLGLASIGLTVSDNAGVMAKVAGVRAELEAEKKTFCDAKHSDYHTGVVWGFVRSGRTLDAAFPSDPGEVKPSNPNPVAPSPPAR